jgi:hypothetical protein
VLLANSLPSANRTRTSASPRACVQLDAVHAMLIAAMTFRGGS